MSKIYFIVVFIIWQIYGDRVVLVFSIEHIVDNISQIILVFKIDAVRINMRVYDMTN